METQTEGIILALENRAAALEQSVWKISPVVHGYNVVGDGDECCGSDEVTAPTHLPTPAMRRARRHVESARFPCYSAAWKWCPTNYYSLSLDERVVILGAASPKQLCKACLFENRSTSAAWPSDSDGNGGTATVDRTDSKYYLIVVQYVESINVKKIGSELRGLRARGPTRLDPGNFADLRLAPEDISVRLTGYAHNAVSPFGLVDSKIPIIVCSSVLKLSPRFMWMGGGDKDLKLGMAVSEFVKAVDAIVLDVSDPRTLDTGL